MFKKLILLLTVLALAFSVVACSTEAPDDKSEKENKQEDMSSGLEDSVFDDETESDNGASAGSQNQNGSGNDKKPGTSANPSATEAPDSSAGTEQGGSENGNGSSGNQQTGSNQGTASSTQAPSVTPKPGDTELTYEEFRALSPSQQQAYMESFDDIDAFFDWLNAAEEEYKKNNPSIEVDGGVVDLEEIADSKK